MDVVTGIISDRDASIETMVSAAATWHAHPEFQSRLIAIKGGCADLAGSRNKLVRIFLSSTAEWLLFVDTDMVWTPEDWERLRDSTDDDHLFISGLYFVANDPPNPNAMIFKDDAFYAVMYDEDSPEMSQVHAVGAGFSLIHRSVYEKTADIGNDHEWYEHGRRAPNGATLPEDYAFCSRVGEAGIPIFVNTKVRVGHVKEKVIGWKEYADARNK